MHKKAEIGKRTQWNSIPEAINVWVVLLHQHWGGRTIWIVAFLIGPSEAGVTWRLDE